jgi:hypothetical protein
VRKFGMGWLKAGEDVMGEHVQHEAWGMRHGA